MTVILQSRVYLIWKDLKDDFYLVITFDILALETGPITIHFNLYVNIGIVF